MGDIPIDGPPEVPVVGGGEFGFSEDEYVRGVLDNGHMDGFPVGPDSPAVEGSNPGMGGWS